MPKNRNKRIGFISTRLCGTDGVSLESAKWVRVLQNCGHDCFAFCGQCDWSADRSMVVPEAHFNHPEVQSINIDLFDDFRRSQLTTRRVQKLRNYLKQRLYDFVERFEIDVLIAENALSIPMNVPLGLAITDFIAETETPTIGHHHDFSWERKRFAVNAACDYISAAFPPTLPSLGHVVINSFAGSELALRSGARSLLIPNVMDFDSTPPGRDAYNANFRADLGIPGDAYLFLQPTRIVPRKMIQSSIELIMRLKMNCVLLVSHESGDEGSAYKEYLRTHAQTMGVKLIFAEGRVGDARGTSPHGFKTYSLADAYAHADLVTYPSLIEGFGNAFLECLYYRRPIFMHAYPVYYTDIRPKGFRVIEFSNFIGERTVSQVRQVLRRRELWEAMVTANYDLGCRYYSFKTLEERLQVLLNTVLTW